MNKSGSPVFETFFSKLRVIVCVCAIGALVVNSMAGEPTKKAAAKAGPKKVEVTVFTGPFKYLGHSPETGIRKTEEGIASDGTNNYLIFRQSMVKVDQTWTNVMVANEEPFRGLSGFDHLGAGEVYDGKLYVAAESYHGCAHVTNQSIFIFDAKTLERKSVTCVSNFTSEVSALTVVTNMGAHGVVFVSNFCDESKLYKFDLSDLSFLGTLALDLPIPQLQGVAYRNGSIYAAADSKRDGVFYDIDPKNGHTRKRAYVAFPGGKEVEGCLFNGNVFEVMVASHTNRFNYIYNFAVE